MDFGIDIVIHSGTKYIGGHSDIYSDKYPEPVEGADLSQRQAAMEEFLDYVLSSLADAGYRKICLVIGPEHARVFADAGWDRAQILAGISEHLNRPGSDLVRGAGKSPALTFTGGFLAGLFSICGSCLLLAVSLWLTDQQFLKTSMAIVTAHVPVMIIEGIITGFCISFLVKVYPEILPRKIRP